MGSPPKLAQRTRKRAPSGLPRFFTARCRSLAMFQQPQRQAGNLAATRCLHFGIAASGLQPLIQQAF
ncbi:hypothetical protein EH227_14625 [Rouxiella chamberiensis]|nr:hypothetical protein EH227_14625 [Rouxiella chamberiensis]